MPKVYSKSKIPADLQRYFVRAEIGLEPTPELFIEHLVEVFREVRRVLRDDGTLWVNLGDTYCSTAPGTMGDPLHARGVLAGVSSDTADARRKYRPETPEGLKPKDLVGIPWMAAFALRTDGWYLRSDIIWAKNSCMPESVRDRPTKAHEYVFLLSKQRSYFYDHEAIREPHKADSVARLNRGHRKEGHKWEEGPGGQTIAQDMSKALHPSGRNKRSVWIVNPKPYKGAHFAVWPPKLVEPMIRAGTSEHGACADCGAPYQRIVERGEVPMTERVTTDWEPTCKCEQTKPPVRCTVMDIFSGSATTGMVALREGRNYIGLDLNPEYLDLAKARLLDAPPPAKIPESTRSVDVFDLFGSETIGDEPEN